MDEELTKQLLQTDRIMPFYLILWKNKIPDAVWKSNKEIIEHYNYLLSLIPKEQTLGGSKNPDHIIYELYPKRKK